MIVNIALSQLCDTKAVSDLQNTQLIFIGGWQVANYLLVDRDTLCDQLAQSCYLIVELLGVKTAALLSLVQHIRYH